MWFDQIRSRSFGERQPKSDMVESVDASGKKREKRKEKREKRKEKREKRKDRYGTSVQLTQRRRRKESTKTL